MSGPFPCRASGSLIHSSRPKTGYRYDRARKARSSDAANGTIGIRVELPNPDYGLPAGN